MSENKLRMWLKQLELGKHAVLFQFVKFGIVGVSNTLISYAIELLCYYVLFVRICWDESGRIFVASVLAFIISVTNSYYWNNRFVFKKKGKTLREHMLSFGKTMLCYGVTGLLLAPALKIWLTGMSIPYWFASLMSLIITIPLNFILNKFWAFKQMPKG